MISGRGDMKDLHGLTVIAAFSAEENELASERVGPFKRELDFVIEFGLAIEEKAALLVNFLEETKPLNHGGYSVSLPVATPESSGLAKKVSVSYCVECQ